MGAAPEVIMPWWALCLLAVLLVAAVAVAWNIALRRRVAASTRELGLREAQFRTLAENSPDAILRLTADGTVVFANAASKSLLGLGPTELVGRKLTDLGLGQEWTDDWWRNIEMVLRTGEGLDTEAGAGGEAGRVFMGRWLPERGADGKPAGVLVLWRDVTELRAVEEERRRIERNLYEAQHWESLGVLAGAVAHDFKNHLAAILGQAESALASRGNPAAMDAALERIRDRAREAAETCRQLSAYSRPGAEAPMVLDPSALVAEMTALLAASLPRGVDLQIACDADLPLIEAEPGQIRQMLLSMMLNAASLLAGRAGVVLLRLARVDLPAAMLAMREDSRGLPPGPYLVVEVSDNGPGLDEAGLQRLFQPYLAPDESGRGLGLAVARAVAMAHRGFLDASSVAGQGTTVQAFLPASAQVAAVAEPTEAEVSRGVKVLIIDDDPMVLQSTAMLLEKAGMEAVAAADGVQGMEKFLMHRESISCVILDLNMPYMNGAETLKNLRASGCDCPVIVASGFSRLLITQEMRDLGIAAFLEKPYSFETLARTLERVLAAARDGAGG